MDISGYIVLFCFSLAASFLQRVSGFGFGILVMTVLPYIMPSYGEATALSGLLAMVTSGIVVLKMWRQIPWGKLLPILITLILVSYLPSCLWRITRVSCCIRFWVAS